MKEIRKQNYLKSLSANFSLAKDIRLYNLESWLDDMFRSCQNFILSWNKRYSLRELWGMLLYWFLDFVQRGAAAYPLPDCCFLYIIQHLTKVHTSASSAFIPVILI